MSLFDVRDAPLSVDEVTAAVRHPGSGGIALFLGVVRDENDGRPVVRLEYEAYASMAIKEMTRIGEGIVAEIPGARVSAVHRVGSLEIGD
ncbi:MAG: molybdenum cofactor biosynthesis protein MoaE, partial [Polyangiaceae bacterium]